MSDNLTIMTSMKIRVVFDPLGCPPGKYIEILMYFGGSLMSHEYLGPLDGNVAAIQDMQNTIANDYSGSILLINDKVKRYVVPSAEREVPHD